MNEEIKDKTVEVETVTVVDEENPTVVEVATPVSEQKEKEVIGEGDAEENKKPFNLQDFLEIPEVKELLQKVRKQEKDKLYADLQKKDGKITELEGELAMIKENAKNTAKDSTETNGELVDQIKLLEGKVDSLVKDNRRKELDLYQANALKEAGDDLIIDLVGGDTEEAIDASITKATEKYLEVVERAVSKKAKVETPKPTNPQQSPSIKQLTPDEINKMSASDWAKHRVAVKKQMGLTK